MERKGMWCFLLLSLLYLWLGEKKVISAKCNGKWAIHACGGGNGKRSDVPSNLRTEDNLEKNKFNLQRILSNNNLDYGRQEEIAADPTYDDTIGYDVDSLPETPRQWSRAERLQRARDLWRKLILMRQMYES